MYMKKERERKKSGDLVDCCCARQQIRVYSMHEKSVLIIATWYICSGLINWYIDSVLDFAELFLHCNSCVLESKNKQNKFVLCFTNEENDRFQFFEVYSNFNYHRMKTGIFDASALIKIIN